MGSGMTTPGFGAKFLRLRIRALPRGRYPHLIAVAGAAAASTAEREFRAGLDALLAGLAADA